MLKQLFIVSIEEIPREMEDLPPLTEVYGAFVQMCELCTKSNGIGLAAVQVGLPWKMFVVRNPDDTYDCYLNCNYQAVSDEKITSVEGCLSLPTEDKTAFRSFEVIRFSSVQIVGQKLQSDLTIMPIDIVLSELYSIVFQHEIDHYEKRVLISDIGNEIHIY